MQEHNDTQAKPLADLKNPAARDLSIPDQKIDMFSSRGFALAQRIAQAFSTADAVPACFRTQVLKKDKNGEQWIENPSAFGNCLVAIETAQAVGMSITAVMQNSNIIEGKLSWAGQFKIGAVNASRRFTPLRFDIRNRGMMKASYKEKDGWNNEKKKYNMIEHTIEIENLECIAWALPAGMAFPPGVATLGQAREIGLPVIEGPPVSMKMAVEEGWYAKPGSKWQTEMKHKMLTIRAGAYFSDIHAPDIVMGMGRSSEELEDVSTIDVERQPNGQYAATNLDNLRGAAPAPDKHAHAETVEVRDNQPDPTTPAEDPEAQAQPEVPAQTGTTEAQAVAVEPPEEKAVRPVPPELSEAYDRLMAQLKKATTMNQLADAYLQVGDITSPELRADLNAFYKQRYAEFNQPGPAAKADPEPAAPAKRARRASTTSAPE